MIIFFLCFLLFGLSQELNFTYPKVARNESEKEIKFGIEVSDPYRWLEKQDNKDVKDFIDAQNKVTNSYLMKNKHRAEIKKGLTDLTNFTKYGLPIPNGGKYYYEHNSGLQNQGVIYRTDSLDDFSNTKIFLDPNKFSPNGTTVLSFMIFSPDGKWLVYGMNEGGADWTSYRIKNVETGRELNETLIKIKFIRPSWSKDSQGFFYSYFDEFKGKPNASDPRTPTNMKVFYHKLDTDQSQDIMIAKFPENPSWLIQPEVSNDGKYLIVSTIKTTAGSHIFYAPLDSSKPISKGSFNMSKIFDGSEVINFMTNDGNLFYYFTNIDAPNQRVIGIDITKPEKSNWREIIGEKKEDILERAVPVGGDYVLVHYLRDAKSILSLYRLRDGLYIKDLSLPLGTVTAASGTRNDDQFFYSMASYLTPFAIYSIDFKKNFENKVILQSKVKGLDPTEFVTKEIFYESKDGTKIPMFIVHRKGLNFTNKKRPAFLYGYGGFREFVPHFYNILNAYFVKNLDGVYAEANIRGGGEYGAKWHKAGSLLNKQNSFDDFHWAAQYLIANNYTTRDLLTIHGFSNGGLLVAATANQRPDLYGCTIPSVGLLDMLRFHKFTIGYSWIPEYGDPDKEVDFKYLLKYSPLHNVPKSGRYPATLLTTGDHDDRVFPAHSLKFISQLQYNLGEKLSNSTPLMIRVDTLSGHSGGSSTTKIIEENTDLISFITNSLKLDLV